MEVSFESNHTKPNQAESNSKYQVTSRLDSTRRQRRGLEVRISEGSEMRSESEVWKLDMGLDI